MFSVLCLDYIQIVQSCSEYGFDSREHGILGHPAVVSRFACLGSTHGRILRGYVFEIILAGLEHIQKTVRQICLHTLKENAFHEYGIRNQG